MELTADKTQVNLLVMQLYSDRGGSLLRSASNNN